jgi:peptidoglycan/LPS O-acetylase OafA/YrhL
MVLASSNIMPKKHTAILTKNEPDQPRVHLHYLDGLRALAALCVVYFHILQEVDPSGHVLKGKAKHISSLFTFGHQSVDVFIVLSGFCLMLPVARSGGLFPSGAIKFYKKRAVRILPPYFFCLAVSLLFIKFFLHKKTGTDWDTTFPVTREGLLLHILLLQDCLSSTSNQINHSLWSISVEWRIYFVFPLMVVAWRKIGGLFTTSIFTFLSVSLIFLLPHTPLNADSRAEVGVMPQYLALFSFGVLGAGIAYSNYPGMAALRNFRGWQWTTICLVFLTVILIKSKMWHHQHVPIAASDFVAGIAATSLLVQVAVSPQSLTSKILSWKPLVFIGTFAYSIYLIHAPIIQMSYQYIIHPLQLSSVETLIAQGIVGVTLTIGFSYLFFLAFERPFIVKRRKETLAEVARDTALSPAP